MSKKIDALNANFGTTEGIDPTTLSEDGGVFDDGEVFDTDAIMTALRATGYTPTASVGTVFDLEARIQEATAIMEASADTDTHVGKRRVTVYLDTADYKALVKLGEFVGIKTNKLATDMLVAQTRKGAALIPKTK